MISSAERPHPLDTSLGAPVDRPLQERKEQQLRTKDKQGDQGHPWLQVEHVAEHARQDPAVEHGSQTLAPTKVPTASTSDTTIEIFDALVPGSVAGLPSRRSRSGLCACADADSRPR